LSDIEVLAEIFTEGLDRDEVIMTVSTHTASVAAGADDRPLAVGLGGTLRANPPTERAMRHWMTGVERQAGQTMLFCGEELDLPTYGPHQPSRTSEAVALLDALRKADAVIVGSPGYHGAVPGLVTNVGRAGDLTDPTVRHQLDLLSSEVLTLARATADPA
jgi:FMN reductase